MPLSSILQSTLSPFQDIESLTGGLTGSKGADPPVS